MNFLANRFTDSCFFAVKIENILTFSILISIEKSVATTFGLKMINHLVDGYFKYVSACRLSWFCGNIIAFEVVQPKDLIGWDIVSLINYLHRSSLL
jgi:hypothetical protein